MTRRIAAAILLTVWATLIAGGLVAYFATRAVLLDDLDAGIIERAAMLPQIGGAAANDGVRLDPGDRYLVRSDIGRIVSRSPAEPRSTMPPEVLSSSFIQLPGQPRVRTLTLLFPKNAVGEGKPADPQQVVFSASAQRLDRLLSRLSIVLGAFGLAGGIAAAGWAVVVSRSALWPLRSVAQKIGSIDESQLDHRINIRSLPEELRPMGRNLNALLIKMQQAFARQKLFIANASHELRTPVAALVTAIEIALRRPRPAEELQQVLQACLTDARLLRRLVGVLLEHVRSTNPAAAVQSVEVRAGELVDRCIEVVRPIAQEHRVKLLRDCPEGLLIRTEPDRLESILINLLANAIEHNREGGEVELAVAAQARGAVQISVRDCGTGIAAEHLPHLFEPFYRVQSFRGSGTHSLGLGLALVAAHASALGASRRVESKVGEGTTFFINLPEDTAREAPVDIVPPMESMEDVHASRRTMAEVGPS